MGGGGGTNEAKVDQTTEMYFLLHILSDLGKPICSILRTVSPFVTARTFCVSRVMVRDIRVS